MRLRAFPVALAIGLAASACGGGSGGSNTGGGNPVGSSPVTPTIAIVGTTGTQAFSPNPAPMGGQSVAFRNNDSVIHRIVLNDGSGDTGDIAPGATSRVVTMPGGGTNFHCSIHPGMIGSVNAASGSAPPPCEGVYCTPY